MVTDVLSQWDTSQNYGFVHRQSDALLDNHEAHLQLKSVRELVSLSEPKPAGVCRPIPFVGLLLPPTGYPTPVPIRSVVDD